MTRSGQFFRWIPEYVVKALDFVADNFVTLFLKEVLHLPGWCKMLFASEHALAVDHTMCRYVGRAVMHGPSHHSGCNTPSKVVCDCTITCDTPFGDEFCDLVNVAGVIMVGLFDGWHLMKRLVCLTLGPN